MNHHHEKKYWNISEKNGLILQIRLTQKSWGCMNFIFIATISSSTQHEYIFLSFCEDNQTLFLACDSTKKYAHMWDVIIKSSSWVAPCIYHFTLIWAHICAHTSYQLLCHKNTSKLKTIFLVRTINLQTCVRENRTQLCSAKSWKFFVFVCITV